MPDSKHLSVWELLRADAEQYARHAASFQGRSTGLRRRLGILASPALLVCLLHRLAHAAWCRGGNRKAITLAGINARVHRVRIDPAAEIGPGLYIPHPGGVMFTGSAGRNLVLFANALVAPDRAAPGLRNVLLHGPRIGDDVMIGFNATVIGSIRIGDGAMIGACAVVEEDVAPAARIKSSQLTRHPE